MSPRKVRKFDSDDSMRVLADGTDSESGYYDSEMGCASSQASQAAQMNSADETTPSPTDPPKYPPPEAFEIPIDDEVKDDEGDTKEESLIKKHPPKRLQRLTEQTAMPTTIEDLEQKLAKAEIRRQKFLQQRVDTVTSITGLPKIKDKDPNHTECPETEDGHGDIRNDTETSTKKDND